jgi:hypothetical protein
MNMSYSVTVEATSTIIVPDVNKQGAVDFVSGLQTAGQYSRNPTNGQLYWAVTDGSSTPAPTHTRGVETVGTVDWLAVTHARDVVISADESNPVWLSKDSVAVKTTGTKLDGVKARSYENYPGAITGIADDGDATITVEL